MGISSKHNILKNGTAFTIDDNMLVYVIYVSYNWQKAGREHFILTNAKSRYNSFWFFVEQ